MLRKGYKFEMIFIPSVVGQTWVFGGALVGRCSSVARQVVPKRLSRSLPTYGMGFGTDVQLLKTKSGDFG